MKMALYFDWRLNIFSCFPLEGAATEEKTPAETKDKKTKKTDDAEAAQYLSSK